MFDLYICDISAIGKDINNLQLDYAIFVLTKIKSQSVSLYGQRKQIKN